MCRVLHEYSGQIVWRGNTLGEAMLFIDSTAVAGHEREGDDGMTVICAAAEIRRWVAVDRSDCAEWDEYYGENEPNHDFRIDYGD